MGCTAAYAIVNLFTSFTEVGILNEEANLDTGPSSAGRFKIQVLDSVHCTALNCATCVCTEKTKHVLPATQAMVVSSRLQNEFDSLKSSFSLLTGLRTKIEATYLIFFGPTRLLYIITHSPKPCSFALLGSLTMEVVMFWTST